MLKAGMVRNLDDLGRIVIPKEIRKSLGLCDKDPIEIIVKDGVITLIPCKVQCVCCGNKDEKRLININGIHMCPACIEKFGESEVK